jgi:glycerol-3-phosphate acyltransferase PlsX
VIRIAVDAMGGDHAPANIVVGASLALQSSGTQDFVIQLVGRAQEVEAELDRQGVERARIEVVDAPEVIGMGEKPLQAVRAKRLSSVVVGLELQKDGRSDAFISAGNTGAVMAASTLILKLYPGFERPAIGTPFPTMDKIVLVLDGGANVDCTAQELVGFAHLGALYARDVMGRAEPGIGLLNIGEEEEKGNAATREAFRLLSESGLRFVGNVEGRDILSGRCQGGSFDVVVCDGFVGNVLLKFYESVSKLFHGLVDRELGAEVAGGAEMGRIWRVLDYAEYGGAPLLGVRGVSIICHGRSSPAAVKRAIEVAVEAAGHHLVQHMASEFAQGAAAS